VGRYILEEGKGGSGTDLVKALQCGLKIRLSLSEREFVATPVIFQSQVLATMPKEERQSPLMEAQRKYDRVRECFRSMCGCQVFEKREDEE